MGGVENYLVEAGKELLIKVVAQTLPSYSMSCFLLPKTFSLEYVSDLIDSESYTWKESVLEFIFSLEDCEVINLIPLSSRLPPDRMIRHYDSKGLFSAKSAYVLARDRILQINNGASSSTLSQSSSEFWSSIWKAHVPAKVKVCMWRACSDILPTHSRLQTRGVSLVDNCVLCGLEGYGLQAFHAANPCQKTITRQLALPRWTPPSPGWLKVNVDGPFHVATNTGGIGMVIRDFLGHFVAGHAAPLTHECSPEQVEVMAILSAVHFIHDLGFQPVIIQSDSLQVVQACNLGSPNLSIFRHLYEDIILSLEDLPCSTLHHVYREANAIAHFLARQALAPSLSDSWVAVSPDIIPNVLFSDCNHI
ncbi:hypothetical protein M0R45_025521 [Rubus argutus]|uniref:RNase H type-1 domain-containing protein n=1 Tax=Rubus argutus TaxID=59490 RepID=A0AAW1WW69_RUBAR